MRCLMESGKSVTKNILEKKSKREEPKLSKEDVEKLMQHIPLLNSISKENQQTEPFRQLLITLFIMSKEKYQPNKKYELMHNLVKIGNILQELLPDEITKGFTVDILKNDLSKGDRDTVLPSSLTAQQQWCVFNITRNLSADAVHRFYNEQSEQLINNYLELLNGVCNTNFFVTSNTQNIRLNHALEPKKKYIELDKKNLEKLLNQAGYFLTKSQEMLEAGNINGAAMALVASGNCTRDYIRSLNKSKGETVAPESIFRNLAEKRDLVAHIAIKVYGDETFKIMIAKEANKEQVNVLLKELSVQSAKLGVKIDITEYLKQEGQAEQQPQSPRAFTKENIHEATRSRETPTMGRSTGREINLSKDTKKLSEKERKEEKSPLRRRDDKDTSRYSEQDRRDDRRDEPRRRDDRDISRHSERDRRDDRRDEPRRRDDRRDEPRRRDDRDISRHSERDRRDEPRQREDRDQRGASDKKRERSPDPSRDIEEDRYESKKEKEEKDRKKTKQGSLSHKEDEYKFHKRDQHDPDNDPGMGGSTRRDNSTLSSGYSGSSGQPKGTSEKRDSSSQQYKGGNVKTTTVKELEQKGELSEKIVQSLNASTGKKRDWNETQKPEKEFAHEKEVSKKPELKLKKLKNEHEVTASQKSTVIGPEEVTGIRNKF